MNGHQHRGIDALSLPWRGIGSRADRPRGNAPIIVRGLDATGGKGEFEDARISAERGEVPASLSLLVSRERVADA